MSIAVLPDGTVKIERVDPEGHQLLFTVPPTTLVNPSPKASVLDVTDNLKEQFPKNADYLVQP